MRIEAFWNLFVLAREDVSKESHKISIALPTQFDLAMYLNTIARADTEGYGSRSSLLGTMGD
jgi:hypothetical protein